MFFSHSLTNNTSQRTDFLKALETHGPTRRTGPWLMPLAHPLSSLTLFLPLSYSLTVKDLMPMPVITPACRLNI